MRSITQHLAAHARLSDTLGPRVVERLELREELRQRHVAQLLRDERLDGDIGQLTGVAQQAAEDECLARDIESAEIVARIGLRVPDRHRVAQCLREGSTAA